MVLLGVVVRNGVVLLTSPPILHLHVELLNHFVFEKVATFQALRDLRHALRLSSLNVIRRQVHIR